MVVEVISLVGIGGHLTNLIRKVALSQSKTVAGKVALALGEHTLTGKLLLSAIQDDLEKISGQITGFAQAELFAAKAQLNEAKHDLERWGERCKHTAFTNDTNNDYYFQKALTSLETARQLAYKVFGNKNEKNITLENRISAIEIMLFCQTIENWSDYKRQLVGWQQVFKYLYDDKQFKYILRKKDNATPFQENLIIYKIEQLIGNQERVISSLATTEYMQETLEFLGFLHVGDDEEISKMLWPFRQYIFPVEADINDICYWVQLWDQDEFIKPKSFIKSIVADDDDSRIRKTGVCVGQQMLTFSHNMAIFNPETGCFRQKLIVVKDMKNNNLSNKLWFVTSNPFLDPTTNKVYVTFHDNDSKPLCFQFAPKDSSIKEIQPIPLPERGEILAVFEEHQLVISKESKSNSLIINGTIDLKQLLPDGPFEENCRVRQIMILDKLKLKILFKIYDFVQFPDYPLERFWVVTNLYLLTITWSNGLADMSTITRDSLAVKIIPIQIPLLLMDACLRVEDGAVVAMAMPVSKFRPPTDDEQSNENSNLTDTCEAEIIDSKDCITSEKHNNEIILFYQEDGLFEYLNDDDKPSIKKSNSVNNRQGFESQNSIASTQFNNNNEIILFYQQDGLFEYSNDSDKPSIENLKGNTADTRLEIATQKAKDKVAHLSMKRCRKTHVVNSSFYQEDSLYEDGISKPLSQKVMPTITKVENCDTSTTTAQFTQPVYIKQNLEQAVQTLLKDQKDNYSLNLRRTFSLLNHSDGKLGKLCIAIESDEHSFLWNEVSSECYKIHLMAKRTTYIACHGNLITVFYHRDDYNCLTRERIYQEKFTNLAEVKLAEWQSDKM